MEKPKLSFYLVAQGDEIGRWRTRGHVGLHQWIQVGDTRLFVVGLGWEGDRFMVHVS